MTNTETIEGGAYQDANGTWINANGEPLSKEKIREAKALAARRTEEQREVVAQQTPQPTTTNAGTTAGNTATTPSTAESDKK